MNSERVRRRNHESDRRKVARWIVVHLREAWADRKITGLADDKSMAIRWRLRGELERDRSVRARTVVGNRLLSEGFAELLSDIPAGNVSGAARRERNDD